jgi:hypothetical protein
MRALSTERDMTFSIFPDLLRATKSKDGGSRTGVLRIRARRRSPPSSPHALAVAIKSAPVATRPGRTLWLIPEATGFLG